jgi:hypothetical protein
MERKATLRKRGLRPAWALALLAGACLFEMPAALADDPTFTLSLKNHQFDPAELAVPANVKVKLIVKNLGSTPSEFESTELRREKVIPGGTQGIVFVGPLRPGQYEFFDDFHPDTRGRLVVK